MKSHFTLAGFVDCVTWTLIHSLWQFAVIAVALAVVLIVLRRCGPIARCVAACLAMVLLAVTNRSSETPNRIRRLLGQQPPSCQGLRALISCLILAVVANGTLLTVSVSADEQDRSEVIKPRRDKAKQRKSKKTTQTKQAKQQSIKQLHKDLALYYSFDDDDDEIVRDSSGNELHGRTVGNVQYQPSFRGTAVKLSNNTTYILADDLNTNRWRSLTVSAWIRTDRITNHAQLFSCGQVVGDELSGFVMQVGGTSKACWNVVTEYQGRARQGQSVYTSSLLASRMKRVGKWVHVTGVFDGTFVKFYINGNLDCQNEVANAAPIIYHHKSHKLVIGNTASKSRMGWSDKYFDGLVDEVKIWKRALTAAEIESIYETDSALIPPPRLPIVFQGEDSYQPVAALASSVDKDNGPEKVSDGILKTFWSAGDVAPGWIELDLEKRLPIGQVELICSQTDPGKTIHHVWVSDHPIAGDRRKAKKIHTFRGQTGPFHRLSVKTNPAVMGRYVQIQSEPTEDSTWLAWSEIAVREHARDNRGPQIAVSDQPSAGRIKFDGLTWDAFRTKFAAEDKKLKTLPQVRPGFHYGHGGHGRGALIATHINDESWSDYQLEFDFACNSCDPKFNPYRLAKDHRGMTIYFRTQGLPESWNEKGMTSYTFGMNSKGGWNLDRWDDYYCAGTGFKPDSEGQLTRFATGESDAIAESTQPGHAKIIVQGNRIQVWINDDLIADVKDKSQSPLLHGGIGMMWRYETMGWIANVKVTSLRKNPGEVPVDLSKSDTDDDEYPFYTRRGPRDFFLENPPANR